MKHMTVRQAMHYVADNPVQLTDEIIQMPVYELVVRTLFEVANSPDANVKGSLPRANRARKLLMDRMIGLRRPGSHPATRNEIKLEFIDLTKEEIEA